MKIERIEITAEFDPDSESWWATADIDDRHALTTGAATLDELLERIPTVLKNLLVDAYPDAVIQFSIVAHKLGVNFQSGCNAPMSISGPLQCDRPRARPVFASVWAGRAVLLGVMP